MYITIKRWQEIREGFTEEEKTALNSAVVGQILCPPGAVLEEEKLPAELLAKLEAALDGNYGHSRR